MRFDTLQDHEFRRDEWDAQERTRVTVVDDDVVRPIQRRNTREWPWLCEESRRGCATALTETDYRAGYCTNCGRRLTRKESQ